MVTISVDFGMGQTYSGPRSCVIWDKLPNFSNLPSFSGHLEGMVFTHVVRIK